MESRSFGRRSVGLKLWGDLKLPVLAFAMLLFVVLFPTRAVAAGGTWPGEPFNGMQITYSVSGLALGPPQDKPGFSTVRSYQATIEDSTLRLSGTVVNSWNDDGPNPGTVSFVTLRLTAGNVTASKSFDLLGKKARAFDLELRVPKGAKDASFLVQIGGHYGNGEGRGLSVDGRAKSEGELKSACPSEDEKTAQDKLGEILRLYYRSIPKGIASSGAANNVKSLVDDKYTEFVCGGYQSKVLKFLDGLRFDEDPCVATLLDDWDYGPIQAWWGGHQAVVIYPRGKDWLDAGLVLDPWMTQSPAAYKIKDWGSIWSPASMGSFQGIGPSRVYSGGAYPTHGNTYYNPKYGRKLSEAEQAIIKTLTPERRKQFDKMTLDGQREWLERTLRSSKRTTVIAHCPLEVYVSDRRSTAKTGVVNGVASLTHPDVSYLRVPLDDGTWWTQVEWPADKDYQVSFVGLETGNADILVGKTDAKVTHYQYEAAKGSSHVLVGGADGSPLAGLESIRGETVDAVEWVDDKPTIRVPLDYLGRKTSADRAAAKPRRWFIVAIAVAFVVLLVAVGLFALRAKRRKPVGLAPHNVLGVTPLPQHAVVPASYAAVPSEIYSSSATIPTPVPTRKVAKTLDDIPFVPAICPRCLHGVVAGQHQCISCGLPLD